jgi:hypothetical protein
MPMIARTSRANSWGVLARRRPPLDFLELSGAGIRIPHCFPTGFTLGSVLRITLQELRRIPLREPLPTAHPPGGGE